MNENDRIDKLPKWAQTEIQVLRMRLLERDQVIDTLTLPANADSKITYSFMAAGKIYALPDYTIIKFKTEPQPHEIHVSFDGLSSDVMVRSYFGRLLLTPEAANSVIVGVLK